MSSGVIFVAALLNNSAWARHCVRIPPTTLPAPDFSSAPHTGPKRPRQDQDSAEPVRSDAYLMNSSVQVFGSQDGCEDGGFSAGTEDVSEEMGALIAGMVSHPGTADELMDSESDLRDTFFRQ
eukprot:2504714-Rhodomonas_salina.1